MRKETPPLNVRTSRSGSLPQHHPHIPRAVHALRGLGFVFNPVASTIATSRDPQTLGSPSLGVLGERIASLSASSGVEIYAVTSRSGAGPGSHAHLLHAKFIVITDGAAEFAAGRDRWLLGPGDWAYVPAGTLHAIQSAAIRPLQSIVVLQPWDRRVMPHSVFNLFHALDGTRSYSDLGGRALDSTRRRVAMAFRRFGLLNGQQDAA